MDTNTKKRRFGPPPLGRTRRRGPYRRRHNRPGTANARWVVERAVTPLDQLRVNTARLIEAGFNAGVTGRDALHAMAAAAMAAAADEEEAMATAAVMEEDLGLLKAPAIARLYRRVGREAWRVYNRRRDEKAAATAAMIARMSGQDPRTVH